MIENIEQYYTQIADSMTETLPEDNWTTALFEATFYDDSITYEAEYFSRSEQKARSFRPADSGQDAFWDLRKAFKAAGKPLWGKAVFHLNADGKFQMNWDYENCDKDGNTLYDQKKEIQRVAARHKRLSS